MKTKSKELDLFYRTYYYQKLELLVVKRQKGKMGIEKKRTLSVVQFGENDDYIYLRHLAAQDFPKIIQRLDQEALHKGNLKIAGKIPIRYLPEFVRNDYTVEAIVPNCYRDEAFAFVAKHPDNNNDKLNEEQLVKFQNLLLHPPQKSLYTQGISNIVEISDLKLLEVAFIIQRGLVAVPSPMWSAEKILQLKEQNLRIVGDYYGKDLGVFIAVKPDYHNKMIEMVGIGQKRKVFEEKLLRSLFLHQSKFWKKQGIRTWMTMIEIDQLEITKTILQLEFQLGGIISIPVGKQKECKSLAVWYKSI